VNKDLLKLVFHPIILCTAHPHVALNAKTVVKRERNEKSLPEPTLDFLLKLAKQTLTFGWRSKEHEKIVQVVFDTLYDLFPGKLFPPQKVDKKLRLIFLTLQKGTDPNPRWRSPLSDKLHEFYRNISSTQRKRFIRLLPLNQLKCYYRVELREICDRYLKRVKNKKEMKPFCDYFQGPGLYAGDIIGNRDRIGKMAGTFIRTVPVEFFEFYLSQLSQEKTSINGATVQAFNSIVSPNEAYKKLKLLAIWCLKGTNRDSIKKLGDTEIILTIANNLYSAQRPITAQLRNREFNGTDRVFLLQRSEIQSWIPKELSSGKDFYFGLDTDLELRKFFDD
jgi:hypothetical protein